MFQIYNDDCLNMLKDMDERCNMFNDESDDIKNKFDTTGKVFVVWYDNGEEYEDHDEWVDTVFSTYQAAEKYLDGIYGYERKTVEYLNDKHIEWHVKSPSCPMDDSGGKIIYRNGYPKCFNGCMDCPNLKLNHDGVNTCDNFEDAYSDVVWNDDDYYYIVEYDVLADKE